MWLFGGFYGIIQLFFVFLGFFCAFVIRRKNENLCFNEWLSEECVSEVEKQRVGINVRFWVSRCGFLVGFIDIFIVFCHFQVLLRIGDLRKNEKLWLNEWLSGEADSKGESGRVGISAKFWVGRCGFRWVLWHYSIFCHFQVFIAH
jgi:hypothetical protein